VKENGTPLLEAHEITLDDLGRIPPAAGEAEPSGAEAARAAAEAGPGASEEPSQGPSSSAPPPPPGAAAVLFVDMVLALGVQLAAQRSKVPFRDVAALAKLSADERALLEQFAPYAAPYLGAVGEASPVVGALAFAGLTALIVSGRFRDVRAAAPKPPPERTTPGGATVSHGPPPAGARAVDVEHLATWGTLADIVPRGTQVRDLGKFPDPPPSDAPAT